MKYSLSLSHVAMLTVITIIKLVAEVGRVTRKKGSLLGSVVGLISAETRQRQIMSRTSCKRGSGETSCFEELRMRVASFSLVSPQFLGVQTARHAIAFRRSNMPHVLPTQNEDIRNPSDG